VSDKNSKKISFRLNDYLYRFISTWAIERKIETSEAVRSFCQNYYMDFMKAELQKKSLMTIEQKRARFLDFINTIGVKDMKRVLKNPEICALMNGMMDNGRNTSKKKPSARAKAKNKA
jgi:hypothetical protein